MDVSVVVSILIVSLVEIIVPLLLGYLLSKKSRWVIFILGMLSFIAVQFVHAPIAILSQQQVASILGPRVPKAAGIALLALLLGMLAGVFEEIGRYLVFRHIFPWRGIKLKKENALLMGAGWGGIESILIGIIMLLTLFAYISAAPLTQEQIGQMNSTGTLTAEQLDYIRQQNDALIRLAPGDVLPGMFERIFTMALHIAFTLLVYNSLIDGKKALLVLAVAYHSVVDFSAVFIGQLYGVLWAELALLLLTLPGAYYIYLNVRHAKA